MRILKSLFPVVLVLATVTILPAALEKKIAGLNLPTEMKEWSFVLGSWDMDSRRYSLDGPVIEENKGKASFSLALNGTRIQERQSTTMGGKPMEVLNVFAFHPDKKEWDIARTDSLHHLFSVMGGTSSERSIVLFERNPNPESRVTRRVTYARSGNDKFSRLLEFSLDKGKTWVRRNEETYTRLR
jgi:hypothetical protein